ncbi:RluA family pseudouridine synthase [Massilimicrobiota timonensis]|uniref:RluA family pseudouridine synthase n=1 Tax=Massilimicrobiota timonensis TaxID=1776392 RepID=UPI00101D6B34|nr:RluA family pseudouridine synthase [Massilimicrobiota timonensis]
MKQQWLIMQSMIIGDFLLEQGISQKAIKAIKMHGDIQVNGHHQTVRYLLQPGEVLTIQYPPEKNQMTPVDIPLQIVYEDDYLLIIDKPAGLPSIPTRGHPLYTLANALTFYYQKIHLDSTIHLVNRLDKETSGLMIVAKYRYIHDRMMKDLGHIERRYQAHVQGVIETNGTIRLPIYKEPFQMKRLIDERGQEACTHYQVYQTQKNCTLMRMKLETGRTHQIRVHMAAIGHPLVGDSLYGDGQGIFDLDSYMVGFIHPITKQKIVITKK